MIKLPKGAFTVKVDAKEEKTASGLILHSTQVEEPNKGEIIFTAEELNKYQGCRVVFRSNFGEDIEINNVKLKYFRDFDSSIFYVITNE